MGCKRALSAGVGGHVRASVSHDVFTLLPLTPSALYFIVETDKQVWDRAECHGNKAAFLL